MHERRLMPSAPHIPDRFPPILSLIGTTENLFFKCFPAHCFDEPISTQRVLHERFVLLNDPNDLARVLVERTESYVRSGFWNRQLDPVLGQGLVVSRGDKWRRQRRAALPAFRPRNLVRHAVNTLTETRRWLGTLPDDRPTTQTLCDAFQVLALRAAVRSLLSLELGGREKPMLAVLASFAELMTRGGFIDLFLPGWVPTALNRERTAVCRAWFAWVDRLLDERLAAPEPAEPDLVSACLAGRRRSAIGPADRDELRDQVSTFLVTSQETTGFALRWAACMLAEVPSAQGRIAAELQHANLDAVFGRDVPGATDTFVHLRATVRETLRLYPPTKVFGRDAVRSDRLGEVPVRKGDRIVISPWVLHRHRQLWDRPDEFHPERFLPGAPEPPRFTYLPFGAGPRVCIGASMGTLTITVVLAALLQRFAIHRAEDHPIAPRALGAGMVPAPMPLFRLQPRRSATVAG
jgi:cytochrome P450